MSAPDIAAFEALMEGHRETLDRVIAIADAFQGDRLTKRILDGLAERAKARMRAIDIEYRNFAHGWSVRVALGWWGENGKAPAIRDILSSAEFHAANGERLAAEFAASAPQSIIELDAKPIGNGRFQVSV